MDWLNIIFQTFGGLGVFLFGMHIMSEGLKQAASENVRNILSHLTKNRFIALIIGLGVTALIQSSSATTVMTVGFVNAGLLSLKQAVAVILGTNIGTTCTAWLISIIGKFNISIYALPAIGIGFFLTNFVKKRRMNEIGQILLGFGLLFLGLDIMKEAFSPIKESPLIIDMFTKFSVNPILGVLVGTVFTMILQSSSATIAIVQLLAFNGVITFDAAIPLILGDNIGTTITAWLASLGTNLNAKRAARAHMLFNVLGVCFLLPFVWLGLYGRFIQSIFPGEITQANIMAHIAVAHSTFNIISAIIFSIFLDSLIKAASALVVKKKTGSDLLPQYLEENLLATPSLAMQQVIKELTRMALLAKRTVKYTQKGFYQDKELFLHKAMENENALDDFQQAITKYLIRISEKHLSARESSEYPLLLHCVNDLEKIGDYATNIVDYANIKIKNHLTFNEEGLKEITEMFGKLYELFNTVISSLENQDNNMALQAVPIEDQIDDMKYRCKISHVKRLKKQEGTPESEMMLMDLATNIEKMGDHLISVAKAVSKEMQWGRKIRVNENS